MTRSRVVKCTSKAVEVLASIPPFFAIPLGKKKLEIAPTNVSPAAPPTAESYLLRPLSLTPERVQFDHLQVINDTQAEEAAPQDIEGGETEKEIEKGKAPVLVWSEEMQERLIETFFEVFQAGRGADNSFKKATFELAASKVRRAYKGTVTVTSDKVKNKWQDLKGKWAHWKLLSEQSGFGWDKEKELFEAYNYVWDALNKSAPNIIWHKTHVMLFREPLSIILHDVQANGKGALTIAAPTPVDPHLEVLRGGVTPAMISRPSASPKPSYNRSRKRVAAEINDDEQEEGTPAKKVDIGIALQGLTKEMEKARKARESYESFQQRAVRVIEKHYVKRHTPRDFYTAITLFKEEGNAVAFLTLQDPEYRDIWLMESLGVHFT
jgi:hypothetical protein